MPHYVFNSNGNQPQSKFFTTVWQSAIGELPYRYLFYGGAIRGGKTYVCLAVLISLLTKYNRAKAIVIRESLSALQSTTLSSFKKFGLKGRWKHTASSQIFEFYNKSELIFFSEAYATDKDGDRFKGLETNFILLEQIEELQEQTWQKSMERVGSHYVPGVQPNPLILSTFNPTQGWVKKMIYQPYSQGELVAPFYYQHASPKDNKFVTQEQWDNWK